MSAEPQIGDRALTGSASDPARAESLSDAEYHMLLEALAKTAFPILKAAGQDLVEFGFSGVRSECLSDMASLTISENAFLGWLRIQIHPTIAVLTKPAPILWMYAVYDGSQLVDGKPGRMRNIDPPAVREIAGEFVRLCKTARS